MTTTNFSKYDVLALWMITGGSGNPTEAELLTFDQDLADNMRVTLEKVMTEEGLPLDKSTRSTVLLYSRFTKGSGVTQKVRRACVFYRNTQAF